MISKVSVIFAMYLIDILRSIQLNEYCMCTVKTLFQLTERQNNAKQLLNKKLVWEIGGMLCIYVIYFNSFSFCTKCEWINDEKRWKNCILCMILSAMSNQQLTTNENFVNQPFVFDLNDNNEWTAKMLTTMQHENGSIEQINQPTNQLTTAWGEWMKSHVR